MTYIPGQSINPINTGYDFRSHGQYNNPAFDNYIYGNFYPDTITPFRAYLYKNYMGYGAPPPGMSFAEYRERIDRLADRFSGHFITSTAAGLGSFTASLALMYPNVLKAVMPAPGSGFFGQVFSAASSAGHYLFGGGLTNEMGAAFGQWVGSGIGNVLSNVTRTGLNTIGNLISPGWAIGDIFSTGVSNLAMQYGTRGMAEGALAVLNSGGRLTNLGAALGWVGRGVAGFAGTLAGFMVTQAILDRTLNAIINAGVFGGRSGIDAKQEEVSDIFESLSERILGGGSNYNRRGFAEGVAQRIREKAIAASTEGIFGFGRYYTPSGDSWLGRFFQGGGIKSRMDVLTAQYGLMAQSGLLDKSNTVDEFIRKADAMYAAIEKLGQALGQTTTKAMETARVLKSQGLRTPGEIGAAGADINLSSIMSGYTTNQVLALASEATESFRGTIFGANMGFSMANDVIRRGALASNIVGAQSWDKTLYTLRGKDSTNLLMSRVTSQLFNSTEIKDILVASLFRPTATGFQFTGSINVDALRQVIAGRSNYLVDAGIVGTLAADFKSLDVVTRAQAERMLNEYSANLSASEMRGLLGGAFRLRGYANAQQGYESYLRSMGLPPTEAYNLSRVLSADITWQEMVYDYYAAQSNYLDMLARRTSGLSSTYLSRLLFNSHRLAGSWTPLLTTGAYATLGALMGLPLGGLGAVGGAIMGGTLGLMETVPYYQHIGARAGYVGASSSFGAGLFLDMMHKGAALTAGAGALYGVKAATAGAGIKLALSGTASLLGAGLLSGYLGDRSIDYISGYMGLDNTGLAAGVAKGITGAGLAAGGVTALSSMGLIALNPVTLLGAAAIGGGYAVYRHIQDNYIGVNSDFSREALNQQMQAALGLNRIRYIDEQMYNALLGKARALSKVSGSILGERAILQSRLSDFEERRLKMIAMDVQGAVSAGQTIEDILSPSGDFLWGLGSSVKGDIPILSENMNDFLSNLMSTYTTSAGFSSTRNLSIHSKAINDVMALRAFYRHLKGSAREQFMAALEKRGLGDIVIVGRTGTRLYNLMDYVKAGAYSGFDDVRQTIKNDLKTLNALLGSKGNLITAENISNVAAAIELSNKAEFKTFGGKTNWISIEDYMRSHGYGTAAEVSEIVSRLRYETAMLSPEEAARKLNAIQALTLSTLGSIEAEILWNQTNKFLERKAVLLGDSTNLAAIRGFMQSAILGSPMAESDAKTLAKLQREGFSSIRDDATRTYLRNATGVATILDRVRAPFISTDVLITAIQNAGDIDENIKSRVISQIQSSYGAGTTIRAEGLDRIKDQIQKDLLIYSSVERHKMTSENLLEINNDRLEKLAIAMNRLTEALPKNPKTLINNKEHDIQQIKGANGRLINN